MLNHLYALSIKVRAGPPGPLGEGRGAPRSGGGSQEPAAPAAPAGSRTWTAGGGDSGAGLGGPTGQLGCPVKHGTGRDGGRGLLAALSSL